MATDWAYPVLRTRDLAEAFAVGRELVALSDPCAPEVQVSARATEHDEWQRLLAALPGAYTTRGHYQPDNGIPADPCGHPRGSHPPHPGEPTSAVGEAGPEGGWQCLPVEVELEKAPIGSVEDALLASVGSNPASLGWWPLKWPAMPELGRSNYTGGYASVEITINCRGLYLERPSDDHTVYLHVQSQDLQRARWLAARIGRDIIGEPLFAG